MKINSNDELVVIIGEGLLWAVVGNYAETHFELLKEALGSVDNMDSEAVDKITVVKVRETDEFIVKEYSIKEGILTVKYEMPAVILAKNDDDSVCIHVATLCTGEVEIPDIDSYHWNGIEFDSLNRTQMLEYSHLVKKISLSYEDIRVGDEAECCMKRPISEDKVMEDDKDEVGDKEQSKLENKKILGITCIPYVLILLALVYCYFGWGPAEFYSEGWWGVFDGLVFMGIFLIYTPLGILLLACILYQIMYFVNWCEKRKSKKNNRVNTSDNLYKRGIKMKIDSNDELVEIIGEGLLWDIVGNYAETHLELLKEALRPLGYIDYEDVDKITFAEVRESDEFIINDFSAREGILTVEYEMPAGILAKNDDGSVCFHVTTWCTGEVEIPDIDSYNWNEIEFDSLNRLQILAYSHLVKKIRLSYEDTEADDLNA